MRIEYICHSCLLIDTGDTTITFDPWIKGGVYMNQWQLFPAPVDISKVPAAKHILYSHGHEDHLHADSLKLFSQEARVFYPFQWRRGAKEYFSELGFDDVTEAVSYKEYRISPTTTVTYVGFALESVIVIRIGEIVIVNLNDALNSHHENVVQMFLREIKKRWPKIDYLFSGWSGAGYFPNTVHYPSKNDYETGLLREQYFAHHFCKIVRELQPERAIPFGPGFALLKKERQWINEVKFSRERLIGYYQEYFEETHPVGFFVINPGDYFEDETFHKISPWHERFATKTIRQLVEEEYGDAIAETERPISCTASEAETIREKLERCLDDNRDLYHPDVLSAAVFSVQLTNVAHQPFYNVRFDGKRFSVRRNEQPDAAHKLLIRTQSNLLHHALDHEWGGDVLTIGYGIDVDVYEEHTLEQNLDIVCVRLITRYPTASGTLKKDPLRALGYFLRHPFMSKLAIRQKLLLRNTVNKFPYNERDHWISWSKCDLCKVCDMPVIGWELDQQLKVSGI